MHVTRCTDPEEFLAVTHDYRAVDPVHTNVIGSVAASVTRGVEYDGYFWWVVRDNGHVVGCAVRTVPWRLVVPDLNHAAAYALGRVVADADPLVPGVSGPRSAVEALYAGLGSPAGFDLDRSSNLMVLDRYRRVLDVPGVADQADENDLDLVLDWFTRFEIDADAVSPDEPDLLRRRVAVKVEERAVWLWQVGGRPVAMAGHAPLVESPAGMVARIGPVYTPRDLRGRGYGSAVTAAVVEALLPRTGLIMLYADANNPTSNGIYERLGFDRRATIIETTARPPVGRY